MDFERTYFLTDSLITFEIATNELENLPQAGAPVYLELDYKSKTEFLSKNPE